MTMMQPHENISPREDLPSADGDNETSLPHDRAMQLSSTLTWLVDAASASPGADRFLAELGTRLIGDDMPLAGGALTLAVPHPIIARRTWLWRAENGEVIEAVGFAPAGFGGAGAFRPAMPAGAGWPGLQAGRCMKTPWARDRTGRCSAGSGRARSRKQRPAGCARPPALPQRHSPRCRRARR